MPFAQRDGQGKIVAISKERQAEQDEELEPNDPSLLEFFSSEFPDNDPMSILLGSDVEITRVLEDLVDLLVAQGVINFTDLPESAQNKLLSRRKARAALNESSSTLLVDDEILKL